MISSAVEILPLDEEHLAEARQMILETLHLVFEVQDSLEALRARLAQRGVLKELDNFQAHYFERNGIFLIALENGRVIGTGGVRPLVPDICELKRLWVRPEHWGKGVGPRLMQALLDFASQSGYRVMRLSTDPVYQKRAVRFYARLGFTPIESYSDDPHDISMELVLPAPGV